MLFVFALTLNLITTTYDPIDTAIEYFSQIKSYQVTLRSASSTSSEEIRYYYKKPGFARMEFIKPHHGTVIVYSPFTMRVRLRPFNFLKFFVFTLSPDNSLVKSSKGHKVDESDMGTLLRTVKKLQLKGKTTIAGDEVIGRRRAVLIGIKGENNFTLNGVHKYLLWLDKETSLPLKASSYNLKGKLIEEVLMDDLQINVEFSENFFEL